MADISKRGPDCDDCEGAHGKRGQRGQRGHRGHDGATGPGGGATGATGPAGDDGVTGLTGPTGDVGSTGSAGVTGPTGGGGGGGATVDFVRFNNLNDDASTVSIVPVDIGFGLNPMIVSFTTTQPNQRIEMRGTVSGVNDAGGTQGFAISFAVDGLDIFASASTGPNAGTAATAALLRTIDIPIPGLHTVSLRWKTYGAGTARIRAGTVPTFENASLAVWGYTSP